MDEQAKGKDGVENKGRKPASTRWWLAAAVGALLILAALLRFGFWASAAVAFVVCLVLAYGKQFLQWRKFIYRGVMPAGAITIAASFLLEYWLRESLPDDVTRLFFSIAVSVPGGILPVLVAREWYSRVRLHWVTALSPDLDPKEALGLLKSLYFGLNYPMVVVEKGQVQTTKQGGPGGLLQKLGGPGLLFVNHGSAAVLEWGGKFMRVASSGVTFLKLYERPRAAVDLALQQKTIHVRDVHTRDGVPLGLDLALWYQIRRKPRPDAAAAAAPPLAPDAQPVDDLTLGQPNNFDMAQQRDQGAKPPPPADQFVVDEQDVINAVYRVENWQRGVESMAEHIARDVIAERTLDTLFDFAGEPGKFLPRKEIRQRVRGRLNHFLVKEQWGVEVTWADIGNITMPESASSRMLEKWLAEWEIKVANLRKEAIIAKGEAEAGALAAQDAARARGSMMMLNTVMRAVQESEGGAEPPGIGDVTRLRLIDALERMAAEHMNGLILPAELLGLLGLSARGSGKFAPTTEGAEAEDATPAGGEPDTREPPPAPGEP